METGWGRFIDQVKRRNTNMIDSEVLNELLLNMKERKNDTEHIEGDDLGIRPPLTEGK